MVSRAIVLVVVINISLSFAAMFRTPAVFRADEVDAHKYSAVLAASEPFRVQCERHILQSTNPVMYALRRIFGKSSMQVGEGERQRNTAIDSAMTKFEDRLGSILKSYDLEAEEFNRMSEKVSREKTLKKRILLQSYLYKLSADLENNLRRVMPQLPQVLGTNEHDGLIPTQTANQVQGVLPAQTTIGRVPRGSSNSSDSELTRFARSLRHIESQRLGTRDYLKRVLRLRELPEHIADPGYLGAMHPEVQRMCASFPSLARDIILDEGLHVEHFNALQRRLNRSPWFRFSVQREIARQERDSLAHALDD